MKIETIEKILNFLNTKENKKLPKKWFDSIEKLKLIYELENHPDGIQYRYKGNLELSDSNITKLPNDLYVEGFLDLKRCKELTKLPYNLYVGSYLSLYGCQQLTELPNKLFVGGFFSLDSCKKITELPDKLHVGDFFSLDSCKKITELPNNLYVGGNLWLANTPLANNYTDDEIIEMIDSKGGTLIGQIVR